LGLEHFQYALHPLIFLYYTPLQIYNQLDQSDLEAGQQWLKCVIQAAIKEHHMILDVECHINPKTGLSRYHPEGVGIPPEMEATHFTHILEPYAAKHGLSINKFSKTL
jgi:alpha,alpha-trehalase